MSKLNGTQAKTKQNKTINANEFAGWAGLCARNVYIRTLYLALFSLITFKINKWLNCFVTFCVYGVCNEPFPSKCTHKMLFIEFAQRPFIHEFHFVFFIGPLHIRIQMSNILMGSRI